MSKKTGLLPSSDRRDAGCATASLRALFELVAARPNCSGREPPVTAHGQRRLARKGPESGPSQWRRRPRVRPGNLCCELHERETPLSPRSPCTELSPEALFTQRTTKCLFTQSAEPGARGAAVAGARRPIAQAKISSETVARIIGGTSFYAPQHSHPCVACQLTR